MGIPYLLVTVKLYLPDSPGLMTGVVKSPKSGTMLGRLTVLKYFGTTVKPASEIR